MRRHHVLVVLAVSLLVSGCASVRQCSGRVTTDNGHVVRNIEDCVWGPQYNQRPVVIQQAPPQYVVVQQAPPPQYVVVQPAPMYMAPPHSSFNLNINIPLRGRRR
jgi:hypothetical protein